MTKTVLFCNFPLRKMPRMLALNAGALFFREFLGLSYNFKVLMSLLEQLRTVSLAIPSLCSPLSVFSRLHASRGSRCLAILEWSACCIRSWVFLLTSGRCWVGMSASGQEAAGAVGQRAQSLCCSLSDQCTEAAIMLNYRLAAFFSGILGQWESQEGVFTVKSCSERQD